MRIMLTALLALLSAKLPAHTQQFTLDNGLKILVKEDHRAPIAVSMMFYNVGSADEASGITGISHVLEHLMFKGTTKYPLGVFSQTIANLGGQENALTSYDYTAFYEQIAAVHLSTSFELEADRMEHLLLNNDEFAKEMKVIQEERRMRTDNNPKALALERYLAAAHLGAPYHHPVIGWMSDLKHMTVSDARRWYQRFYAPNNATLIVVGDVNASNVHALAKHYFGDIKKRPLTTRKPQKEPPVLGKKTVVINTPTQVPMLIMGYTVPSMKTASSDQKNIPFALDIIGNILDSGDTGRFEKNLVDGAQIASSIGVYYNPYARFQTQFIVLGAPSKHHTMADLESGVLSEINRLKTQRISNTELQTIKTRLKAQKTFQNDSIFDQALELGLLETLGLGWQTADEYIKHIDRITPEDIQKTAQTYFTENNITEAQLIQNKPSRQNA